jgi:hypothetical protein
MTSNVYRYCLITIFAVSSQGHLTKQYTLLFNASLVPIASSSKNRLSRYHTVSPYETFSALTWPGVSPAMIGISVHLPYWCCKQSINTCITQGLVFLSFLKPISHKVQDITWYQQMLEIMGNRIHLILQKTCTSGKLKFKNCGIC